MSRNTVRVGIADYLAGVPGLQTVFRSVPKTVVAQAFQVEAGQPSGAVAVVYITGERERRWATGFKLVTYAIELELHAKSTEQNAEVFADWFDELVDAVKARLRADHTLGGRFWSAAEGNLTEEIDISGTYGEPTLDGQVLMQWGAIGFFVYEWLQIN